MEYIFLFIFIFLIVFIYFKVFYKIKQKKIEKISIISVFVRIFKLDRNKMNIKTFLNIISLMNSLIIAFVSTFVMYLDIVWNINYFVELLVGFILIVLLIYSLYNIVGRVLNKKWRR